MIERRLNGETAQGPIELAQDDLLTRPESLIILGEAGMGKTELTYWLGAQDNFLRCTARQLIYRNNSIELLSDAVVLVVDALDEVGSRDEGEAVDLVLRALGQLRYPRFIMSCRVSDWRSATGRSAIRDQYGSEPIELHLKPFTSQDVQIFLQKELGEERASEVVTHFKEKRIGDLLGNPQTLLMIASVAKAENLPNSVGSLFESYVDIAWSEHSDLKPNSTLLTHGSETVHDALGAAFCALIFTGSDALSRRPRHIAIEAGDLPMAEVSALPEATILPKVLDSRLVHTLESERFTYPHRRIGEFMGAKWLVRQATTARKRRRLLAQFHSHGLIPASLRGIYAWLAWHDQKLAQSVIAFDPMGLIEYGDADELTVEQGKALLESLEALAARNPRLPGWEPYSVRGIIRKELIEDLRRIITAPEIPFGLRLLVMNGVTVSSVVTLLADSLSETLLDIDEAFAIRSAAAEALAKFDQGDVWLGRFKTLHNLADDNSSRLALQIFNHIGFAYVSDQLIAEIICAHAGVSFCPIPKSKARERTVNLFNGLQRNLPDERVNGVLDLLSEFASTFLRQDDQRHDEFNEIFVELVARGVRLGNLDSQTLWRWLKPLKNDGSVRESAKASLAEALRNDDRLRRDIQRYVLLEMKDDKNVWQRAFGLMRRSNGFSVTSEDAIDLLSELGHADINNTRWKDVVALVRHTQTEGTEVRIAAKKFLSKHDADSTSFDWIDSLCEEKILEWEIDEKERQRKDAERRDREWGQHRIEFGNHVEAMRAGDYRSLVSPAKAYLKLFHDIGDDLLAHERVVQWLGLQLASAAYEGFEVFLRTEMKQPSAEEISKSHAEGQHWEVAYIIVAGMAERLRAGRDFSDLSDEMLISGFYELLQNRIDSHAGLNGLFESVEQSVRARGLWASAIKGWVTPQLQLRKTYVDGLYSLMGGEDVDLATALAIEWLDQYPDLLAETEISMVDRLIHSGEHEQLKRIVSTRQNTGNLDDERRRLWDAVDLLVNFDAAVDRFKSFAPIEPKLIWHLRARSGHRRGRPILQLSAQQISWIVSTFRSLWPAEARPSGVTSGDDNSWDASEYLFELIGRLADNIGELATEHIALLRSSTRDGYTEYLQIVTWEQLRKRVETLYQPPLLIDLASLVRDEAPADAVALQAVIVEEISVLQRQLVAGGDAVEPHVGFFVGDKPHDEEACRDHLVILLRDRMPFNIVLRPEGHLADDKEVDIECSLGRDLMVPIEIKGQWHKDVWHAADTQLARLYTVDWRSERRGIYLVLWFGNKGKKLKNQSLGLPPPQSAEALQAMLSKQSKAAQEGLVEIIVLDLTRP